MINNVFDDLEKDDTRYQEYLNDNKRDSNDNNKNKKLVTLNIKFNEDPIQMLDKIDPLQVLFLDLSSTAINWRKVDISIFENVRVLSLKNTRLDDRYINKQLEKLYKYNDHLM